VPPNASQRNILNLCGLQPEWEPMNLGWFYEPNSYEINPSNFAGIRQSVNSNLNGSGVPVRGNVVALVRNMLQCTEKIRTKQVRMLAHWEMSEVRHDGD